MNPQPDKMRPSTSVSAAGRMTAAGRPVAVSRRSKLTILSRSCIRGTDDVPRGEAEMQRLERNPDPPANPMIFQLFRRDTRADTIAALYGAIVAQARRTEFYRDFGVPDTVEGRLDMIVLHVFMVFRRMRGADPELSMLGQGVFDRFCEDVDHNFREMGVSDLAIPRRMRRVGEAFYGRAASYEAALAVPGEDALAATLAKNVFGAAGEAPSGARRFALYVRASASSLEQQLVGAFVRGALDFPKPDAISA